MKVFDHLLKIYDHFLKTIASNKRSSIFSKWSYTCRQWWYIFTHVYFQSWSYTYCYDRILYHSLPSPSTVGHQTISIVYTWKYNIVPPIGYLFKIRTRSLWWIVRDFDLAKSIMLLLWLFRYNFEKFFGVLFLRKFGWF